MKKVLYIFSNIYSTILHIRFLLQSFASHQITVQKYPSHYTQRSPFPYAALHYSSLHFTSLHFQMIFTSLHFLSLHVSMIFRTLYFSLTHLNNLFLTLFFKVLFCRGEFLILLQVAGSSLEWSYSQRNISLYPSFASDT